MALGKKHRPFRPAAGIVSLLTVGKKKNDIPCNGLLFQRPHRLKQHRTPCSIIGGSRSERHGIVMRGKTDGFGIRVRPFQNGDDITEIIRLPVLDMKKLFRFECNPHGRDLRHDVRKAAFMPGRTRRAGAGRKGLHMLHRACCTCFRGRRILAKRFRRAMERERHYDAGKHDDESSGQYGFFTDILHGASPRQYYAQRDIYPCTDYCKRIEIPKTSRT